MTPDATKKRVLGAIRERRELVSDVLDEGVPMAEPKRLYEASRYLLRVNGKRLRPTVSLLTVKLLTDVGPVSEDYQTFPALADDPIDVMIAAMSIGVIQSFTLIHGNIMDDGNLRRGVPAVHKGYDNSTAILVGDTLYARAFELLTKTGAGPTDGLETVHRLAATCTQVCKGQALDIEFEHRTEMLPDEYLQMAEPKTAVFYGTATAVPAVVMGADDEVVEALYQYGIASDSVFQIQDDVLNLTMLSDQLGKRRGSDSVENKEAIIPFHARQQGTDVDDLVDTETIEELTEDAVEVTIAELNEASSIDYAHEMAEDLIEQAELRLNVLPDSEAHDLLCDIADYFITRSY